MYQEVLQFEALKENILKYNPHSDLEFIRKAAEFAVNAHEGQNRKSDMYMRSFETGVRGFLRCRVLLKAHP